MKQQVVIVDYGMGNLRSVQKKLIKFLPDIILTSDPYQISKADKLLLPGVGHFAMAVKNIIKLGIWDTVNETVLVKGTPVLGICLGMQLMARHSQEGNVNGFGWFDAEVVRFKVEDKLKYKIPHIGWNNVLPTKPSKLFEGIPADSEFYFVHSYHIKSNKKSDVLAFTEYESSFVSAFERNNIFGVQFHPEKSHIMGEKLLSNFLKI
ncbi:MAG: imidazole glycerol phosphate synthase subunit HisH [Bacteroidales bacterium]|nr:imidazole glycerol phosphate synthase subunit HisH [Bacteroidales bacterium]